MAFIVPGPRTAAILLFAVTFAVAGCVSKVDTRLTDDQQSCRDMGHSPGSAEFNQCMSELNERRCATVKAPTTFKGQLTTRHSSTIDCTRL